MSFRAIQAVMEHSRHTHDEFTLLLTIAYCINKDTGEAFPSITYLANKARMGRRRTFRALKRLRAGGELQVTSARGGGSGKSNRYRLNPLPLISDTQDTNNSDTNIANAECPNSDKSSIRIVTQRARNSDNGGHTILSYPDQKPGGEDANASAHARRIRKKAKTKPKTGQPWPDDFILTTARRKVATDRGLDLDLDIEFELFHNKALSEAWLSSRWDAKWNHWVLQEVKFAAERAKRNGASRLSPLARNLPTVAEVEAARAAKREH